MRMRRCLIILRALTLLLCSGIGTVLARREPFGMRISCGAWMDVRTAPTNTLWYKDFAYTGGIPANATLTSIISPPLKTLRYFPLSGGPESCYNINRVPKGSYSVRVFFGLVAGPNYDSEPLFDVSIEGTQVHSLRPGWTMLMEHAFAEGILFLKDGSASICFHSTGHGDPAVLSIEILQVDDAAYYLGSESNGLIFRTVTRLNCGRGKPKFDADLNGDHWGGDRYWNPILTFVHGSDKQVSTVESIRQASVSPNFYPVALYQSALVGTDKQPELEYIMDVDPNRNYSIWLHFAEIDQSIRGAGKRVFDVLINGKVEFKGVDIVKMSGDREAALVLNTTVPIDGRTLTVSLIPKAGHHALINAMEVFEIITAETKTLVDEVRALQTLKKALALPQRLGWNGDPCIPQQHPWVGADCQFDPIKSKWVIDGISLDNQGLRGSLPKEISKLSHLQSLNLSGNSIQGHIPSSLGTISSLQILDLSYNFFNGSIPESLGQLTSLRRLNLNGNSLSGKVPAELGGRLLHRASFNFTDNAGLCGIPGLCKCGANLTAGGKIGIAMGALAVFLLLILCLVICWKRQKNILRAQTVSAREAPYAKSRTQFSRDLQMSRHGSTPGNARIAAENGPSLLS